MDSQKKNTYYLIDTENIKDRWSVLLPLDDHSRVILFYTNNSSGIPYSLLDLVLQNRQHITLIPCFVGHNAMDFQLVSELGYCIAQDPEGEYWICSNDQGYDAVCKYWQKKEICVKRRGFSAKGEAYDAKSKQDGPAIPTQVKKAVQTSAPIAAVKTVPSDLVKIRSAVQKSFGNEFSEYIEPTTQILKEHGIGDMSKIYQAYLKQYGQKSGLVIYKKLRTSLRAACQLLH